MNLYTIIVTYNAFNWINKNIKSLLDSSVKTNIIVIDNGSKDGTQQIIEKYVDVHFIQSEENLGFGKANNLGIKLALDKGADYIFLLNQDAWIEKNTLSELLKVAEIDKSFGIISPLHLNGSGTGLDKLFSHCIAPSIHHLDHYYFSDLAIKQVKEFYQVPFINGAAWLIPKETFKKVGFFDKLFFHYGEDENFCQRIIYHDLKIVFSPKSKIYHDREEREINTNNSIETIRRNLLIEFTNLNNSESYIKKRLNYLHKHYLFRAFIDVLKLRIPSKNYELFIFCKSMKSKVYKSRKLNIKL